jgi:hypothetical protein
METKNQILIYSSNDKSNLKIDVRLEDDTVWLTQAQIAELFGKKRPAITKHLINIYNSGELNEDSTSSILEHMGNKGVQKYKTKYYNLDVILSVGYRVNSINATQFRIWASKILKDYLLKGYVLNQRVYNIERKLIEHDQKFEMLLKTNLPQTEGIFYDGQIFDAYKFVIDLIKTAQNSIILIDNYCDESVLLMLSKRNKNVKAEIYTFNISKQLQLDLEKHNQQYESIFIHSYKKAHDRFLIIDRKDIYHIGASLKDLGKKWFAFSKINIDIEEMLTKLKTDSLA